MKQMTRIFKTAHQNFANKAHGLSAVCRGTTPNHIRAMAEAVGGLAPITEKEVKTRAKEFISVQHERTEPGLNEIAAEKRSIIAELDPPKN